MRPKAVQNRRRPGRLGADRSAGPCPMPCGFYGGPPPPRHADPDVDSSQGYRQFVDYNIEAEALGYTSTFLVEHHFTGFGQVSASLSLLTWVAAKTKTLRLGTAVMVLPWH